jgi:hypothetical protein
MGACGVLSRLGGRDLLDQRHKAAGHERDVSLRLLYLILDRLRS